MADPEALIDDFLARALVAKANAWPANWNGAAEQEAFWKRVAYHGIGALLLDTKPKDWPDHVILHLRDQSVAQAMWEERHRQLLGPLLAELAQAQVPAIILKGTALAYDLYPSPHTRSRADTDLLVRQNELAKARLALTSAGYRREDNFEGRADDLHAQEVWRFAAGDDDAPVHEIDLHWQTMNSMALRWALSFDDCAAGARALPSLHPAAATISRSNLLIHACLHRAGNRLAPYFIDETRTYGGDRLIWTYDIHLLANALSEAEWDDLCAMALRQGLAPICIDGLRFAGHRLGTMIPAPVLERLASGKSETQAVKYLMRAGPAGRAIADLRAVNGLSGKARYLVGRAMPSANFIRARYPNSEGTPLPLLYVRRVVELLRKQPGRIES
jgi:hypothetical protein